MRIEVEVGYPSQSLKTRMLSVFRKAGCTSRRCVDDSPGFDAEFVVDRYSQTLPAANIAFSALNRDMLEEKLYLFKIASRIMAEPRTGPAQIMRRQTRNVHADSSLLHNVPVRLF